jgi:hypothetical protein
MAQSVYFKFTPLTSNDVAFADAGLDTLLANMYAKEKALGLLLSGYVYYDDGGSVDDVSVFDGGHSTMKIYNNPRWWESGAKSCVRGCCRKAPDGYVIGTVLKKSTHAIAFNGTVNMKKLFDVLPNKVTKILVNENGSYDVSATV